MSSIKKEISRPDSNPGLEIRRPTLNRCATKAWMRREGDLTIIYPLYIQYTIKLGFKELFGPHKKVPYFKHLTKVPYKVYFMKNRGKMAIFLESILLLTKNISLKDP